ncbi:MAG: DNA recombination protein RmuC [Oscillospiraceae bacterium]|nr:DNA recombination protein RmuC [Oscillospiraceae bacterium]
MLNLQQKAFADTQQAALTSMSAMGQNLNTNIRNMREAINQEQRLSAQSQNERIEIIDRHVMERQQAMNQSVTERMQAMEQRLANLEKMNEQKLEALRQSMQTSMQEMRQDNNRKLDEIRGTVDEKLQDTLQKKITESFKTVSDQLEQVYKGLGEMQNLASDVGGLKQVLSGVKTRGILGEIQLGAILEEILSPEQYETNVATIPGSRERVEFAVKLPGTDGGHVYLPIDSKFPADAFMHLQDAQTAGDPTAVEAARKGLTNMLKASAKDIRDKYVEPPYTTTFGILFLPFEGLYAEVVNMGLIEILQRDFSINVAGPSTMAALLNSLQMGFRTLAIQKRSNEVWQVLGEVKTEFGKFEDVMGKMQNHLRQTSDDLENLMGTRTRAINRKLRSVQQLDAPTENLLGTEGE